jgi:hypothetical protein
MVSGAIEAFAAAFRDQYNRSPVWPPGSDMALGDVGERVDGEFVKLTTLEALGVSFEVDRGDQTIEWNFSDGHGVAADVGISGQTTIPLGGVPAGNFGVHFKYSGVGSFNLTASGCRIDRIKDLLDVNDAVLSLHSDGHWDHSWRYITALVVAERYAIAVSASNDASAVLDLGIATPPAKLANASASAGFTSTHDLTRNDLALNGGPLMYEAWRLRDPIFSPASVRREHTEARTPQISFPIPD